MKQSIDRYQFRDAFRGYDREDNFSYAGLSALFDYLEDYEDATGDELELDVIAICCEFTEYENISEFQANYGTEYETIEDIEDQTPVIMVNNQSFIIQAF